MQRTLIVLLVVICLFSVEAKFLDRVKALFRKLRRRKGSGSTPKVKTEEVLAATATEPTVSVPIIDIGDLRGGTDAQRMEVAKKIGKAAEDIGFFVITNHGISTEVQENMWKYTTEFFDTTVEEKMALEPQDQAVYPFGYSKFKGEVLSAGKATENKDGSAVKAEAPPDLKEMFSLGPANPAAGFPPREWPSNPAPFAAAYTAYYDSMADLASTILKSFALVLDLPSEDYFEQFITHHASALRALNYPHVDEAPVPGQLRASAHTDYGTITILKADAPGLQVSKDKDPPSWVDVPYVEGAFIVNLGDLMKRWTNDRWLSTLHRVVNPDTGDACWNGGSTRRQSVAFFHNLNRDAVVENLVKGEPAKHQPIVAGDFLMQKHLAATQGK